MFEWFKQAWLQEPKALKVINDGLNHVPTIHVNDVARLVKKVILTRPTKQYLVAVDKTNYNPEGLKDNSKLLNIITSISKNVGSGDVTFVTEDSVMSDIR